MMTQRDAAIRQYEWMSTDAVLCVHRATMPETSDDMRPTGRSRCVLCGALVVGAACRIEIPAVILCAKSERSHDA
jgi:hypothetical protein